MCLLYSTINRYGDIPNPSNTQTFCVCITDKPNYGSGFGDLNLAVTWNTKFRISRSVLHTIWDVLCQSLVCNRLQQTHLAQVTKVLTQGAS